MEGIQMPATQTCLPRSTPLAACLAIGFSIGATASTTFDMPRPGGSIAVTNCDDDGAGSLRDAVDDAVSGDTIDMAGLNCSLITLTTGTIAIGVDDLTLQGPDDGVIIDGDDNGQVFFHFGLGTLVIDDLIVRDGWKYAMGANDANGGCIYSKGNVQLTDSEVKYCSALAGQAGLDGGFAGGGGVFALGGVFLSNSSIHDSRVETHSSNRVAHGGGVFAQTYLTLLDSAISNNRAYSVGFSTGGGAHTNGSLIAKYSTVSDNIVRDTNNLVSFGGGLYTFADVTIVSSTISGNIALSQAGAMLFGDYATSPLVIRNSTISDNISPNSSRGSGLRVDYAAEISNSTITGNTENNPLSMPYGAGLFIGSAVTVTLQSTMIGGNRLLGGSGGGSDVGGVAGATLTGADNLITQSFLSGPSDTITGLDPRLAALSDNGGMTLTHALLPDSPAINHGNTAHSGDYDQRGPGYPRVIGAGADIGAFESDLVLGDLIFANGFE
jgi:hypothetical protein